MSKKALVSLISMIFLISCMAEKTTSQKVNQAPAHVQQERAKKAFEELDRETGDAKPTPKVEEKRVEEKKVEKPAPKVEEPVVKEEPKPKQVIVEKESPNKIVEKKLEKGSYPLKDGKPIWFWEPNYDGYLGAVGIARKNAAPQGYAGQLRLAKTLALAELAKQIRVVINTEATLERTQGISNNVVTYYKSKFSTLSKHTAEEIIQDAVIKDEYKDPSNGDLYVWVVIEK